MKIEPLRFAPGMPRQGGQRFECHMVGKRGARLVEQLLQHPAHGEHRGAAIDSTPRHVEPPHLAARSLLALDHQHLLAPRGEAQGGGKPPHSSPDDDDAIP